MWAWLGIAALWNWTGLALATLSVALAVRALVGRRSKQPRCRGCWYDMTGIGARAIGGDSGGADTKPAFVCPECGRAHDCERALRKARRRWGWFIATALVWLSAQVVWCVPRVQARGWVGWVPTWVLVLGSGSLDTPPQYLTNYYGPEPEPKPQWPLDLMDEMTKKRAVEGSGSSAIERWLILQRALAGDRYRQRNDTGPRGAAWRNKYLPVVVGAANRAGPGINQSPRLLSGFIENLIDMPEGVVNDMPSGAVVFYDGLLVPAIGFFSITPLIAGSTSAIMGREGGSPESRILEIGPIPPGTQFIEFEVRGLIGPDTPKPERWRLRVRKPVITHERLEDVAKTTRRPDIRPLPGDAVPTFTLGDRMLSLQLHSGTSMNDSALARLLRLNPDLTVGVRLIVEKDGQPVAEARQWWRYSDLWANFGASYIARASAPYMRAVEVNVLKPAAFDGPPSGSWKLRVIGDPAAALLDPRCSRWWDGEIEQDLRVREHWQMTPQ